MSKQMNLITNKTKLKDTHVGWIIVAGIAIGAAFGAISGEGNIGAGMVMGASFTIMGLFLYLRQNEITVSISKLTVANSAGALMIGLAVGAAFGASSGEGNLTAGMILGGSFVSMLLMLSWAFHANN